MGYEVVNSRGHWCYSSPHCLERTTKVRTRKFCTIPVYLAKFQVSSSSRILHACPRKASNKNEAAEHLQILPSLQGTQIEIRQKGPFTSIDCKFKFPHRNASLPATASISLTYSRPCRWKETALTESPVQQIPQVVKSRGLFKPNK